MKLTLLIRTEEAAFTKYISRHELRKKEYSSFSFSFCLPGYFVTFQVDVDLAKRCAEKPEEDDEGMKRKLWLQIAKHVVKEQSDIQKAMEILQECPLLKIEDVLPFFPDFVTIDHFKVSLENIVASCSCDGGRVGGGEGWDGGGGGA